MKLIEFLELFFVIISFISMPFIIIGTYFNFVPRIKDRSKPMTIIFLIVTLVYAFIYSYFAWKNIQESKSWKRIVLGEKDENPKEK